MTLFMNGKMFDNLNTMTVTDESGAVCYTLKRDKTGPEHRVTLCDANGTVIADIEQRGSGGKAGFAVLMNGAEAAVIERKNSLAPNYTVTGPGWDITGSLFSTKYKILKGENTVAVLKVALLKSEIEVTDETDLALKVAVVMAIRFALYRAQVIGAVATSAVMGH